MTEEGEHLTVTEQGGSQLEGSSAVLVHSTSSDTVLLENLSTEMQNLYFDIYDTVYDALGPKPVYGLCPSCWYETDLRYPCGEPCV